MSEVEVSEIPFVHKIFEKYPDKLDSARKWTEEALIIIAQKIDEGEEAIANGGAVTIILSDFKEFWQCGSHTITHELHRKGYRVEIEHTPTLGMQLNMATASYLRISADWSKLYV